MDDSLDRLLEEYASSTINRRDAMKRAAALGLSATALAGILTGTRPSIAAANLQDEPVAGGTLREGYDLDFSRMDPVGTNWYDPAFSRPL